MMKHEYKKCMYKKVQVKDLIFAYSPKEQTRNACRTSYIR